LDALLKLRGLVGAILLAACAPVPQAARIELAPDEQILISRPVWDSFVAYEDLIGYSDGVFVVSEDGNGSGYVYCPTFRCSGNYEREAIRLCERAGVKCVIFARGLEILVDYEIVE